jgi:8-oxo-dGTP diphosphatase
VVEVALAALYRRTASGEVELLVARRHAEAIRGGLWEFPGGKIEPGEAAESAALRELEEEVGIGREALVAQPSALTVVEHSDPDVVREKSIRLHAYVAEVKPDAVPRAIGASEVRWIKVGELGDFEWPKANASINAALAARLG